jgi:septal ring factor EnvC (AmiA/AmiB activator)
VSDLTAKWAALNEQSKKKDGFAEKIKAQNEAIEEQQRKLDKLTTRRNALASENKSMGSQKSAEGAKKKAAQKELDAAIASRSDLEGKKGGKSSAEYAALG